MPAMQGTRSLDEMIRTARSLSYQEQYSYTEGWNDNVAVDIFNLGLDKLYAAITQIENPAEVNQYETDVIARQVAYDLPIEVHMALRLVDVRYLYGTQAWEFITLRQGMIQDRFSYPTNIPDTYCIRNGQMLLSPAPNQTKTNALIINYQKRMKKMDIRRGQVESFTSSPYVFQLSFATNTRKNAAMEANADSLLDLVDWATLVDTFGNIIMPAISLERYDQGTRRLYALDSFAPTADQLTALNDALSNGNAVYVVQGDYSSTHSELDRQCEDALIEYAVLRFLRLASSSEASPEQINTENEVITRLINQYRRVRPTIYPIVWQERLRPRSWPWGRRGLY
jgi:hypothetical protein